tara:strand:+ start:649 stop:909 length:261 start_codon:yes stop_codon:yes gene_type:complete
MNYTIVKTLYGGSLAGGAVASAALVRAAVQGGESSSLLELSVGAGVAVLILKEVFAYLRLAKKDDKDKLLHKIHDLLIRIDERLNK